MTTTEEPEAHTYHNNQENCVKTLLQTEGVRDTNV